MHSEWSDEFLLSNGNLGAYILAILIDAKILEFQLLSSNTGQGFTKNDLQKRMKAVVCCCFAFFVGFEKQYSLDLLVFRACPSCSMTTE